MKHAFSKVLTGPKFWQTCKLYVCKHLLRQIIADRRFGVIVGTSTVIDCTDKVVVTSDHDRNLILEIVTKED